MEPPDHSDFVTLEGVWCQMLAAAPEAGRPALFLDRDGVVVEERHHLHRPDDLRLIPGAAEVVARANEARCPVVIVSNQSGIGKGIFGWVDFAAVQARLIDELARRRARVDMVLACPHHPEGKGAYRLADPPFRKPNPGMLTLAAERLGLELSRSWLVGDKADDILAARRARLGGALHVLTGHGREERPVVEGLPADACELVLGDSIAAAARLPIFDRGG